MDASFRKQLESALRFGTTLFIHDAENFDPLVNPVLNRDLRRTAGRVLITIGDKDIDFSPTFRMFLFTRDSDVSETNARVSFRLSFRRASRRNLDRTFARVSPSSTSPSLDRAYNRSVSTRSFDLNGRTLTLNERT